MSKMNLHRAQQSIAKNPSVIQPHGNYIVIHRFVADEETAGGIVLPSSVTDKDRQMLAWALAVGDGQLTMDGRGKIPCITEAGDLLIILRHAPVEMRLGGETCFVISEGDVIGRVDLDKLASVDPESAAKLLEQHARLFPSGDATAEEVPDAV